METSAPATRRTGLALAGLALVLAAPAAYLATMGSIFLLRTGLLLWVLLAAGLAAGLVAARADRRRGVRILAGAGVAVAAFLVASFFVFSALPGSQGAEGIGMAPDFTLPDEGGKVVSLAQARASGPVLLVFFRGAW